MTDNSALGRVVEYGELPLLASGSRSHWWDCTVSFNCFCGQEVILSEEDYLRECDCGREWRLKATLFVRGEPSVEGKA